LKERLTVSHQVFGAAGAAGAGVVVCASASGAVTVNAISAAPHKSGSGFAHIKRIGKISRSNQRVARGHCNWSASAVRQNVPVRGVKIRDGF
jgi:hypothetical protein